jgi:hypothetical protein
VSPRGELVLDHLGLSLPNRSTGEPQSRSVATLHGGAACVFRHCTITLEEGIDRNTVIHVMDAEAPALRMQTDPNPRIRMESSLIRGTGTAIGLRAARPIVLELINTAVALDGSFLTAEPATREWPGAARLRMTLTKSTAALSGSLLEMRANRNSPDALTGLIPCDVDANQSLFTSVGSGRPLILFDGADPAMTVDRAITWQTTEPNSYAFGSRSVAALEIRPRENETPIQWDFDDWLRRVTREPQASLARLTFPRLPTSPRDLVAVTAADLTPQKRDDDARSLDTGADSGTVARPYPR